MKSSQPKARQVILLISALLVTLFFYTAVSKLLDMESFKGQLAKQTLPVWSLRWLVWLIPVSELLVCFLLIIPVTRPLGFYGSTFLMLLFSGYMGLVLLNVFERRPCSCGGVLSSMHFESHFLFNLVFLTLSFVGIYMSYFQKKGGPQPKSDAKNPG